MSTQFGATSTAMPAATAPWAKFFTPIANPVVQAPVAAAPVSKTQQMLQRMAQAEGFDAKNAIFHEYFDVLPESDVAGRTELFVSFMGNIAKPDADRVMAFLEGLDAAK